MHLSAAAAVTGSSSSDGPHSPVLIGARMWCALGVPSESVSLGGEPSREGVPRSRCCQVVDWQKLSCQVQVYVEVQVLPVVGTSGTASEIESESIPSNSLPTCSRGCCRFSWAISRHPPRCVGRGNVLPGSPIGDRSLRCTLLLLGPSERIPQPSP